MRKILLVAISAMLLTACGSQNDRGELVGAQRNKAWHPERPYGMSFIPAGSYTMGKADYDMAASKVAPSKTVSVSAFYMDETEITNIEYREFVQWVRDSVFRSKLALYAEELGEDTDEGIGYYRFTEVDTAASPYAQYMLDTYGAMNSPDMGLPERYLDWSKDLVWDYKNSAPDTYYAEIVDSLFVPDFNTGEDNAVFDTERLEYVYYWLDIKRAIAERGKRNDYVVKEQINIYPDTTVWNRDFTYSYNEPLHSQYFHHQAFNDYPVVGVNWKQAKAFCSWRTKKKNSYQKSKELPTVSDFRLPSEAEWEYAARGGLEFSKYPWGGPYISDDRGCFLANFKPMRGDYLADGAMYTVKADEYEANNYGLFNMAGNVSEWTNSSYDPSSYYFVSTMNPNYDDPNNKRKVIRGGSWKDVAYYLQVSTRDYEYEDTARSYVGFRTVQDFQGN